MSTSPNLNPTVGPNPKPSAGPATLFSLDGRRALVTGASRGLGRGMAEALAAAGADVVCASSRPGGADDTAAAIARAGRRAWTVAADLADREAVLAMADEATRLSGGLDILVNNAGGLVQRVPITEVDDALFDAVVDLNVRSLVAASAAAVPHMRRAGHGNIVNVTSIAARSGGGAGSVIYASAKGFVSTFTRGLAKELVRDGIRVNAVSPGVITTPFHERYSTPAMLEAFRTAIPMNRLGTADECAGAFLYLASDALSGFVTGQILEVNGGQLMP